MYEGGYLSDSSGCRDLISCISYSSVGEARHGNAFRGSNFPWWNKVHHISLFGLGSVLCCEDRCR